MSLIASDKGGGNFKPVPAGTHRAVCTLIADMGVQPSARFKPSRKVYIRWELPDESIEWVDRDGGKHTGPMVIGKQYTLSLSEKANLRADLESWRGKMFTAAELKGFDLENILGKPCMIGVKHDAKGDKIYANIAAVMGLSKGTAAPKPSGELLCYSIEEHDEEVFQKLPKWLQEAIGERVKNDSSPTVDEGYGQITPPDDDIDDPIPF